MSLLWRWRVKERTSVRFVVWCEALEPWGSEALLRALLAVGDRLAPSEDGAARERMGDFVGACEAWFNTRSVEALRRLSKVEAAIKRSGDAFSEVSEHLPSGAEIASDPSAVTPLVVEGLYTSAGLWGEQQVRDAVEQALIKWSLREAAPSA